MHALFHKSKPSSFTSLLPPHTLLSHLHEHTITSSPLLFIWVSSPVCARFLNHSLMLVLSVSFFVPNFIFPYILDDFYPQQ